MTAFHRYNNLKRYANKYAKRYAEQPELVPKDIKTSNNKFAVIWREIVKSMNRVSVECFDEYAEKMSKM